MPAVSQQQQKIMGLALSVKRGDTPRSEVSDDVLNIVDSMSEKDLEKYAGTEHTGLPKTVEVKIREMVRELYKEMKSVNEEKVVTKQEWDRIHKDFKGMVNGKPHMMYLDPKTDKTVYGPVTIKESITELTVSRIPNLNLESDSYIHMLDVLKSNSTFKKIVSTAGIDLYSGANSKTVFNTLKQNLKKVLSPQIISSVVSKVNQKRERLSIRDTDIQSGKYSERFAGILALGLIDSFMDTPVDTELIKDLGNSKLATMAKEFSVNRGKGKVSAMMANKNNESITEAKFNKGDLVRVVDRPKYVWDKQFWGKSGYIKGVMGKDILVTFPNGRTIVVDAKDIELNKTESVTEAKSIADLTKDANRIKGELSLAQKEYSKSPTETNKAKVEAKKGQLERVANAIRNARADERE